MYKGLTAKNSRLCHVQPPGAAPEPSDFRRFQRLSDPSTGQRSARPVRRAVSSPSGVRSQVTSKGRLQTRHNRLFGPHWSRYAMAGERSGAAPGLQRKTKAAFCRQRVPDGPTLDAPDCVADQDPRKDRDDAERKLGTSLCSVAIPFGVAPRVAFWPSPHPRIRWTVASPGGAIRAHGNTRPPPS